MSDQKPWYKEWWGIFLIISLIFVSASIVAFALYVFSIVKSGDIPAGTAEELVQTKKFEMDKGENFWIGSANPKVTIVEFADFTCSYSQESFRKIRELGIKYNQDVKIIFRDFPLRQEYSTDLALAARCAGEQGLFWPMHDKLFQNQGVSTAAGAEALAFQAGADMARYRTCITSSKYLPQIQKDILDATSAQVAGTPTWFINGYKLEGDIPMETWEEIIQKFIK